MQTQTQTTAASAVHYPDADGKPMADNTKQYRWIVRLGSNLRQLLKEETAFIAPSNAATEISQKQAFYDRYGVIEDIYALFQRSQEEADRRAVKAIAMV